MSPSRRASRLQNSLAWNAAHLVASRGLALLTRLALARLLAPEHFGLFSLVAVALGLFSAVADFGLQNALVQRRSTSQHRLASSACWALAISGMLLWALVALAGAPALAAFHEDARLLAPAQALAAVLLLNGLAVVPTALLMRQGRFRPLVIAEFAGVAIGAAAALLLAHGGHGVWSLVVQQLLGAAVTAILVWLFARWRPECRVRVDSLRSLWPFSSAMAGTRLLVYLRQNLDQLCIGAMHGALPLGVYVIAYTFSEGLRMQVVSVLSRVLLPFYSQYQTDPEKLRRHYLRATSLMLWALAPLSLATLLYAEPVCLQVLGPAWADAVTPMRILAVSGLVFAAGGPSAEVLQGIGRPQLLLRITWRNGLLVALPATVLLTWWYGTAGAACAFILMTLAQRLSLHRALRDAIGLRTAELWQAIGPPLACAAAMVGASTLLRGNVPLAWEVFLLALLWVGAGAGMGKLRELILALRRSGPSGPS